MRLVPSHLSANEKAKRVVSSYEFYVDVSNI